jgi:hypothetical protein
MNLSDLRRLAAAATLALAPLAAPAQMLADAALEALYQADRSAELQRAAQQRLAAQPDDAQAVLALALATLERNDAARREALDKARGCAERQPRAHACHYALGVLLGVQAMSEGLFAAARSAGTVREALGTAHALDPSWYPGRSALVEFHVLAPAMMGGSRAKAAELAAAAPRPEQRAALQARLQMAERSRLADALPHLLALLPVAEPTLRDDVLQWGSQAGLGLVNDGQAARAQAWFERVMREHPEESVGPFGLARVKGELGDWAGVPPLLERAARQRGARQWPIDYRLGLAQLQLGQRDAARASLQRFVDAGRGQKPSLEDARKRLAELGTR